VALAAAELEAVLQQPLEQPILVVAEAAEQQVVLAVQALLLSNTNAHLTRFLQHQMLP
jgi:hypothetical protein